MASQRRQRRPGRVRRFIRRLRALFSSTPPERPGDDFAGGVGVREPRRPLRPTLSGAVALEEPPPATRHTRAVGEEAN